MDETPFGSFRAGVGPAGIGKPVIAGLVAILILVAVFAGKHAIDTATASSITVVANDSETIEEVSAEAEPTMLFVHVSGAVANPGIVELPVGSRVFDAVSAAGGFADGAATASVNLARELQDGEQIHIQLAVGAAETGDGSADAARGEGATGSPAIATAASGRVNINTASPEELESLPGIGPSTAAKIVADREANGFFSTVDDLTRVSGVGEKKLASLADLICV